jgi:hypothetical protein
MESFFVSDEEPIRVFLSYSSKDKEFAGQLKAKLETRGFEAFLAHEDIKPTQEWEAEIFKNLKACDAFIPLLSENFAESDWCDQETGFAVSDGKLIIPLKIDVDPYGFIGKIQALKLGESIPECCDEIVGIIKNTPLFDRLREVFIDTFVKSKDFDNANENSDSLESYEPFTADHINRIIRGFLDNYEISHGFRSARVVRRLFKKYEEVIDPDLKTKFNEFER